MAKIIALTLAFTAVIAIVAAHTTVITTAINDENPTSQQQQRQCSQQLQQQRLNQCQTYLGQQGQSPNQNPSQQRQGLDQCCQELGNINEQCRCAAMQQVFDDVQKQQLQQYLQSPSVGAQQIQRLKQMVQNLTFLANECNPQMKQRQCQIVSTMATASLCQSYISQELQSGSPRTLTMNINKQGKQQSKELQQCCNEIENLPADSQCEGLFTIYGLAMEELGGEQEKVMQVVRNLQNECDLQAPKCFTSLVV